MDNRIRQVFPNYNNCAPGGGSLKKFLTSIKTARRLNISDAYLRRSRVEGLLGGRLAPPYIKIGTKVLYDQQDVEDWLTEIPKQRHTS